MGQGGFNFSVGLDGDTGCLLGRDKVLPFKQNKRRSERANLRGN
jgi:hypothetical protein